MEKTTHEPVQDYPQEVSAPNDRPVSIPLPPVEPRLKPHPSKSPLFRWLTRSLILVTAAGASAVLGAAAVLFTPIAHSFVPPEQQDQNFSVLDLWRKGFRYEISRPVNILVMGIDRVPDAEDEEIFEGRSDTMLLVRVDPETGTMNVLSIPRDTQVEIPGYGVTKVNHANAEGGARLAADVVSVNLGDVPIDRYVRVSTEAFKELVDLLGGVEVTVPYDMQYTDQTQGLDIDLRQGTQILSGDQAEQFARFRGDAYGDIGRVQRQQELIRALRDRIANPSFLPRIPQAVELMQTYIDTNLTMEEILALVDFGLDLDQDAFRMVMLPGRFSEPNEFIASYWLMDYNERDRVMADYFGIQPTDLATADASAPSLKNLRIAIQNASDRPEVAGQVADYLLDKGFNNVYIVQDWPNQQEQTQIIVQRGNYAGATSLETVLGLGRVVSASTGDLESDFTIRVGEDWLDYLDNIEGDRLSS